MLTRITLHNFVVFVTKNFCVFISYTVYRNKLIDMFINNMNGFINKNLSLFFFRPTLNYHGRRKKNSFFISLIFFENSGYKETKNTNFLNGIAWKFFGSSVDHFSNKPYSRTTRSFKEKLRSRSSTNQNEDESLKQQKNIFSRKCST